MKNTKIEWAHHTFNPWWGCVKVSDACAHCYAEAFAKRTGHDVWGADKPRRFFGDSHWKQPLLWNAEAARSGRQRVFCASMADLFEKYSGPDREQLKVERNRVFRLVQQSPNIDWLFLTKRPENMIPFTRPIWGSSWPKNVWALTTVENQLQARKRIPYLLQVPAAVRGLSCEPLLGALDLSEWFWKPRSQEGRVRHRTPSYALHWVIAGGESGGRARPSEASWFRSLRDQCLDAEVAFFFKQWGDWKDGIRFGKKDAGRILDRREWNDVPNETPFTT